MSRDSSHEWETALYKDVANFNPKSLKASTPKDFHVEYIDIGAVSSTGKITGTTPYQFENAPSRARRVVNESNIIISTVRPYLRAFAYVDEKHDGCIASTGFAVLDAKDNVDPEFLFQTVLSEHFLNAMLNKMKGSNYPAVTADDIQNTQLRLPSLPEQKKIAAILSSVDEAINATQAVIDQTGKVKEGLLQDLLTRGIGHTRFKQTEIGEIPEGWRPIALGEIADFINGRGFKPHEWSAEGLPIIRIQNLNGSDEYNYYSGAFNPKILVQNEDLLFAWSGSRGTSFGPHIWHGSDGLLNYHTWKIQYSKSVERDFLYYALMKLTKAIEQDAHGASALVHMRKCDVVDFITPLPPLSEQKYIVEILNAVADYGKREIEKLAQLQRTKRGLMQDLLSGYVRVAV